MIDEWTTRVSWRLRCTWCGERSPAVEVDFGDRSEVDEQDVAISRHNASDEVRRKAEAAGWVVREHTVNGERPALCPGCRGEVGTGPVEVWAGCDEQGRLTGYWWPREPPKALMPGPGAPPALKLTRGLT